MLDFSSLPTTRPAVQGRRHVVSSGHYLASQIGLRILDEGGNAVDAGVATGLALNVVQPDMTSIGGVAPIMIHIAGSPEPISISGVGCWPRAASVDWFLEHGHTTVPEGILATVMPAAADAWLTALARYGTMSLAEVLGPAVELAEEGFPVHRFMYDNLATAHETIAETPSLRSLLMPGGRLPEVGALFIQKDLARTFRLLIEAESGERHRGREAAIMAARERFYRGDIAGAIVRHCEAAGGLLTAEDLAGFSVEVEPPVTVDYRGYDVFACGPWCQGPTLLEALNILEGFDLNELGPRTVGFAHVVIETLKLALADRHHFIGDPRFVDVPLDRLLDKAYAAERRQDISMTTAWPGMPPAGLPSSVTSYVDAGVVPRVLRADTSYVGVVDSHGNGFSATPSDGMAEGTPLVPGFGFLVSGRGKQSWVAHDHPASVAPGKRPRLTPSPAMVLRDGELLAPFGTPGGDVQPQAMLQFLVNLVDFGMEAQTAVEAPRFVTYSFPESGAPHQYRPGLVKMEAGLIGIREGLEGLGHKVESWPQFHPSAGAVCAIVRTEFGTLSGASDPRRTSAAAGR